MATPSFVQKLKKDIPGRTPTPLKNRPPEGRAPVFEVIAHPTKSLLTRRTLPVLVSTPFLLFLSIPFDVLWKQTIAALAVYFLATSVITYLRFTNLQKNPLVLGIYEDGLWFPHNKIFVPASRILEGFMPRESKKSPGTGSFFITFFAPPDIIGAMNTIWQKNRLSFICPGVKVYDNDKTANTALIALVMALHDYDGLNLTVAELTQHIEALIATQKAA